ncbi:MULTISPECIES: hypothetical protein [Halobacterium]|uniref:hypothetical protein n=1 Tax=Halobacterium TaxID=2239 RepID=UPI001E5A3D13|nr:MULTISPECIES: hypothetical protein [Halobacterium]MDL0123635.1 hypothetical protein [Halobacterium salinarum]UDF60551.1 hypothetical protein JRZ79_13350 [Halobacterium sp. BOL4-2]
MTKIDSNDSEVREVALVLEEAAKKERMAKKVVANSDEYRSTDQVIRDFSTMESLDTKLEQMTGVTANIDSVVDTDIDVSSGGPDVSLSEVWEAELRGEETDVSDEEFATLLRAGDQ